MSATSSPFCPNITYIQLCSHQTLCSKNVFYQKTQDAHKVWGKPVFPDCTSETVKGKNSSFQIKSDVYFCLVFSTGLQLVQVWPIIYGVNSTQKSTPTLRIKFGLIINRALPEHPTSQNLVTLIMRYTVTIIHLNRHPHTRDICPLALLYIYACRHKFVEQLSWKSSGAHMARYQKHDVLCYIVGMIMSWQVTHSNFAQLSAITWHEIDIYVQL